MSSPIASGSCAGRHAGPTRPAALPDRQPPDFVDRSPGSAQGAGSRRDRRSRLRGARARLRDHARRAPAHARPATDRGGAPNRERDPRRARGAARKAHRPWRPALENVILMRSAADASPEVVLLDAGSDRLRSRPRLDNGRTELFSTVGSPRSVSPGRSAATRRPRRVMYSFGALFYEMLTGKPPFGDAPIKPRSAMCRSRRLQRAVRDRRVGSDPDLDAFLLRLLSKEPAARPSDARAALELFQRIGRVRIASQVSIPPEDLDSLIATLVRNPEDDGTALSLESASETPELAERIAGVFQTRGRPVARQAFGARGAEEPAVPRRSRLGRVARDPCSGGGLLPEAARAHARRRLGAGRFDRAATEASEVRRGGRTALGARRERLDAHGEGPLVRGYRPHLRASSGDRDQALVAFTQALTEDPTDSELAAEIERLAGSNANA